MITFPESFWILFVIIIFCLIIKEAKNGGAHSLNPEKAKQELEDAKELLAFTRHKSWLIRVADRESRRMEKRLEYLYRLRKKAVKRFGEDSEQVVRIDKWLMEVRRYMLEFSRVSTYADKLGTGI
ncbi:hypothetical protein [Leyella stercorea]|jgi:hypothetical protein|uniref:hypothetical protein n=1 Tax=Leyella stercorea TaxID=363265 RepID=UPI00266D5873|nr:hypothetical protein [Leyella stercorea]